MKDAILFIRRHRVAAVIAFLLVFPLLMPYQALAINILIFGLFAVGFNLLFGYTGLLSFGHAAFLGVGSYLTGIGMVHFGMPWGLAVLLGVASAALVGVVMGYLAIRTRGIYFSMVTLALAQIVYYAFYKAERWTGGENGLRGIQVPQMEVFGFTLDFLNPNVKYYVILAFVAVALWFVSRLLASPFGAVIEAVRENEKRAAACGYDVARTKLLVFVISAALCGLAGALRALHLSVVPIESLHYLLSGQAVMMCLLGGMGTFFGPFIGAGVFLTLEDVVTTMTKHWMAIVGTVFIIFVLFFPAGIWGTFMKKLEQRA
ncbi:branched-chain amino acid ABC transporter permease [Rubrivivax rivuli]|uniref:Branched-chain amino acid ABC transporter permease n=1 Tax=Rubrivivax rivuli TaxID=1862385 RepID=A0A437RSC5_9BURK|nr:branched-chain amino acid ABC transporter permease [Rubrivivax rivuli]RVU49666.1 branched-chain amino acid ABC transporter permease [Rubrivivax rivuli]